MLQLQNREINIGIFKCVCIAWDSDYSENNTQRVKNVCHIFEFHLAVIDHEGNVPLGGDEAFRINNNESSCFECRKMLCIKSYVTAYKLMSFSPNFDNVENYYMRSKIKEKIVYFTYAFVSHKMRFFVHVFIMTLK